MIFERRAFFSLRFFFRREACLSSLSPDDNKRGMHVKCDAQECHPSIYISKISQRSAWSHHVVVVFLQQQFSRVKKGYAKLLLISCASSLLSRNKIGPDNILVVLMTSLCENHDRFAPRHTTTLEEDFRATMASCFLAGRSVGARGVRRRSLSLTFDLLAHDSEALGQK